MLSRRRMKDKKARLTAKIKKDEAEISDKTTESKENKTKKKGQ